MKTLCLGAQPNVNHVTLRGNAQYFYGLQVFRATRGILACLEFGERGLSINYVESVKEEANVYLET
jgi:hypothetical protein